MTVRLAKQLARDDKALIDNSAYRRRLRRTPSTSGNPGPAFEIDPGKVTAEARYDGLFVLRRTPRITPVQAVQRYRDLLHVEDSSAAHRVGADLSNSPHHLPRSAVCSSTTPEYDDDLGNDVAASPVTDRLAAGTTRQHEARMPSNTASDDRGGAL